MMKIKVVLSGIILVIGLSGCSNVAFTGEKLESPGVESADFSDMPSPPGMLKDDFASYGHVYTKFNSYTTIYRGDLKEVYIADFYRNNMSRFGWQLESDNGKELTFSNRTEKCTVTISSEGVGKNTVRIERGLK